MENNFLKKPESKSKKILLISPDSGGGVSTYTQFHSPPLGVMRLAGYLTSKGHHAEYFDPNLYNCNNKGLSLKEIMKKENWDIIGFSILDDTLLQDIQNIYLANKLCPKALILAGGIHAQFDYQTVLDKTPCKIVVLGEGEIPITMLAEGRSYNEIPGIVVKNNAKPLTEKLFNEATNSIPWEKINYEAYWDVYKKIYGDEWSDEVENSVNTIRVFSRNRCPIGCKYCSSTFQLTAASELKVPVISQTEDSLIHVIKRIKDSHPKVKMIYLTDDDFIINKRSVIRFCQKVVENNFGNLKFMAFARITDLNEEIIQWLYKANFCKLNIGVESFSQRVLDEVGKRCDAREIDPVLKLLKKYNIQPFMNIIMTTPNSRIEDVEFTVDKILEILQDPFYLAGPIIGIMPLKGTLFYEENYDFKSYITEIKGTPHKLKRDDYIWPKDPLVREILKRYLAWEASVMKEFVKKNKIRHPNQDNLARMHFKHVKKIINEIKLEVANGGLISSNKILDGAGRWTKESPTAKAYASLYNAYAESDLN